MPCFGCVRKSKIDNIMNIMDRNVQNTIKVNCIRKNKEFVCDFMESYTFDYKFIESGSIIRDVYISNMIYFYMDENNLVRNFDFMPIII